MSIITDPLEKLTTKWMWLENVLGSWSFQGIPPITEGAKELDQLRARIAELEANGHEAKSYLTRLVIHFGAEPLDTLLGLCTQIDNILSSVPRYEHLSGNIETYTLDKLCTPDPEGLTNDEYSVLLDSGVSELVAMHNRIAELEAENLELRKPVVILGEKLRQPPEE